MPAPDFYIKQGDLLPALHVQFYEGTDIKDLTGKTVKFNMKDAEGTVVISAGTCAITDVAAGKVKYSWQSGDTDTVGRYFAEFYITSDLETFPNDRDLIVEVVEQVD